MTNEEKNKRITTLLNEAATLYTQLLGDTDYVYVFLVRSLPNATEGTVYHHGDNTKTYPLLLEAVDYANGINKKPFADFKAQWKEQPPQ